LEKFEKNILGVTVEELGGLGRSYYYPVHLEWRVASGTPRDRLVVVGSSGYLCVGKGVLTAKGQKNLAHFCDKIVASKSCEEKKLREGFLSERSFTELRQKKHGRYKQPHRSSDKKKWTTLP